MWAKDRMEDPNWESTPYDADQAYGWSKLANQLFAYELQRRLTGAGSTVASLAAHPGGAATESASEMMEAKVPAIVRPIAGRLLRAFTNSPAKGALPELRAATDPRARGGEYYGPDGFRGARGFPVRVQPSPIATDTVLAERMWTLSEELTGVRYLS